MSTGNTILKAHKIINSLSHHDLGSLSKICYGLQSAQDNLLKNGKLFFQHCYQHCSGICCKNIYVDDIVTLLDFIYILTLNPTCLEKIVARARKETIYTGDCFFLENESGPCMFPPDQKPERCIITFCQDTGPLKREIRAIRKQFSRIHRFIVLKRPTKLFGF